MQEVIVCRAAELNTKQGKKLEKQRSNANNNMILNDLSRATKNTSFRRGLHTNTTGRANINYHVKHWTGSTREFSWVCLNRTWCWRRTGSLPKHGSNRFRLVCNNVSVIVII